MKNQATKIEGTIEAWDTGLLGESEEHIAVSNLSGNELDKALDLKPISIRLENKLIEDLKLIAKLNGIGYQPLIRQVLHRFTECEIKHLLRQMVDESENQSDCGCDDGESTKKAKVA